MKRYRIFDKITLPTTYASIKDSEIKFHEFYGIKYRGNVKT